MYATNRKNLDIVKALLNHNEIDVHIQDSRRGRALHYASICSKSDIIKILLKKKMILILILKIMKKEHLYFMQLFGVYQTLC